MWRLGEAVRWSIFPVVLFGSLALAWSLTLRGVDESVVVVSVCSGAFLLTLVLQRLLPAVTEWRWWRPDVGVDTLHVVLSSTGGAALAKVAFSGALFAAAAALSARFGAALWPTAWPLVVQFALALVIADLPSYGYHRVSHTWEPLWRLHALHHSSERLYLLSSARTHPVHVMGTWICQMAPLIVLGAPSEVLLLLSVFTPVHGFLQHANIDLRPWPFHWVFATVDLHRWHHSSALDEEHRNYGNNLIVWDLVFGTRHLPADRRVPEHVGLADVAFPRDYWGQIASPLTWARLPRRSETPPL